ncbi:hypothetical protein [Legionella jordanis]|nr:hypothetical protein [Legionella jordanis]
MSLIWFTDAYAYLDPGTGSLIIQSTIAAVTGGLFVLKTYWHKLKSLFCRKQNTAEEEKSQSPESPHNH